MVREESCVAVSSLWGGLWQVAGEGQQSQLFCFGGQSVARDKQSKAVTELLYVLACPFRMCTSPTFCG